MLGGCQVGRPLLRGAGPTFPTPQQDDQLASTMDFRLCQTAQTRNTKSAKDHGLEGHPWAEAHPPAPQGQGATQAKPAATTITELQALYTSNSDSFNAP